MARVSQLDVFFGDEHVGSIHDSSPLSFEYAPGWLAQEAAFPIAGVTLAPGLHEQPAVQAYFENLLPEGELRSDLGEQKKASTLFSLLLEVAGDTAGAFVILPARARRTRRPSRCSTMAFPGCPRALRPRPTS